MSNGARISFVGFNKNAPNTFLAPQAITLGNPGITFSTAPSALAVTLSARPGAGSPVESAGNFFLDTTATAAQGNTVPNSAIFAKMITRPNGAVLAPFDVGIAVQVFQASAVGTVNVFDGIWIDVEGQNNKFNTANGVDIFFGDMRAQGVVGAVNGVNVSAITSTNAQVDGVNIGNLNSNNATGVNIGTVTAVNAAIGLKIGNVTGGGGTFAIQTGLGPVNFGDVLTDTSGINFGNTTLKNYQEGTFTATLNGFTIINGTGGVTATGKYTRVGNAVTINVVITPTGTATIASTGGGTSNITGIPFAALQDTSLVIAGANASPDMGAARVRAGSGQFDTPTWAANNNEITISGTYLI
jgi:hypothetical protein